MPKEYLFYCSSPHISLNTAGTLQQDTENNTDKHNYCVYMYQDKPGRSSELMRWTVTILQMRKLNLRKVHEKSA